MFKKLKLLLMGSTAMFLLNLATVVLSTTSMYHHGEVECPQELLE